MRNVVNTILCLSLLTLTVLGGNFSTEKQQLENRLKNSLTKLSNERAQLKKNILPLLKEIRSLKEEENKWSKKIEDLRSVDDSKMLSLEDIKEDVEALERELNHLNDVVLREFITEERSSLPSFDPNRKELREMDLMIESETVESPLLLQMKSVSGMVNDLNSLFNGSMIKANVLDDKGVWVEGQVYDLGPEAFFKSKELSGRLKETEDDRPQLRRGYTEEINNWFAGKSSNLPLDVSGGDALSIESAQVSAVDHVKKGGVWVYPIIVFACLAALVAFVKSISLYTIRISDPRVGHDIALLLREGKESEAVELAEKQPGICKKMWVDAIQRGRAHAEVTEEVLDESLMELQPKFERFLSFIAVSAAIAPLMGLLGTVTGIIKTFQMMEVFGAGDPKPLIGGISEALITTELGLILAIPALLMHALLSRKAKSIMSKLERSAIAMVNGLIHVQIKEEV